MILPFTEELQQEWMKTELTIFTPCCDDQEILPEGVYQEFRMIQMDFLIFSPLKPDGDKIRSARRLDFLKN